MDCWDGPSGTPIVYHGHTLYQSFPKLTIRTTRISLKEVVEAIAKYAFSVTPYPLILSLEVHCSLDQQDVMAKLFQDIFGNALVTSRDEGEWELPSPEALRGRILLKGKVMNSSRSSETEEEEPISPKRPSSWKSLTQVVAGSESTGTLEKTGAALEKIEKKRSKPAKKTEVSLRLMNMIVYCKKIHFEGFFSPGTFSQLF